MPGSFFHKSLDQITLVYGFPHIYSIQELRIHSLPCNLVRYQSYYIGYRAKPPIHDTSNTKSQAEKPNGYMHESVAFLFLYSFMDFDTTIYFVIYVLDFLIFCLYFWHIEKLKYVYCCCYYYCYYLEMSKIEPKS